MYKRTLFMLLAAFVLCGIAPGLPGQAFAQGPSQGPMLYHGGSGGDAGGPSPDGDIAEAAFTVLFNTERVMLERLKEAGPVQSAAGAPDTDLSPDLAENAFATLFNTERVMLSRDDEELSRIHGAGPGRSRPREYVEQQADARQKDAHGPMLAHHSPGPMLALDDAGGPALNEQEAESPDIQEGPDAADEDAMRPPEPDEIPRDQAALYEEVRELRGMVDQLRKEAEAREHLRVTDEEERDEESEILEAAGREYSLRPPWQFQMDLRSSYSYNDYDVIRQIKANDGTHIEHIANHTITNSFSLETGIRDNLSIDASVPFVYIYDKVDTADSKDTTNLGDISLGLKFQPLKTGRGYPSPIFSFDYTFPTGKSPYDIDPATELSTGSGFHAVSGGVSVSQPFDPVNAFASLRYRHRFKETGIDQERGAGRLDEVDPGDRVSASLGFGYAVSYRMSMTMSLGTTYSFSTDYYWLARDGRRKTSSGDSVSASLNLNTSWRVTPQRTIIIGIGKGLTTANPGFTLSARMPFVLDRR